MKELKRHRSRYIQYPLDDVLSSMNELSLSEALATNQLPWSQIHKNGQDFLYTSIALPISPVYLKVRVDENDKLEVAYETRLCDSRPKYYLNIYKTNNPFSNVARRPSIDTTVITTSLDLFSLQPIKNRSIIYPNHSHLYKNQQQE